MVIRGSPWSMCLISFGHIEWKGADIWCRHGDVFMTLSALMAFICPKLTFPVTRTLSTSAVATAARRVPCESHEFSSLEELSRKLSIEGCREKQKTNSRSVPRGTGTSAAQSGHAGVLSGISLLLIARDHQRGYLTLRCRRIRLRYITGPKGHRVGKAVTVWDVWTGEILQNASCLFAWLWHLYHRFWLIFTIKRSQAMASPTFLDVLVWHVARLSACR